MATKAVFLDRDGTLIDDPGYLSEPSGVKLLPGVELALKSLRQAGYKLVVVTNQSGVARGLLSEQVLEQIHSRLRNVLADKGAALDAVYYCPYHPEGSVEKYARDSDLRKPKPGMLELAARELGIDLSASWMVGDSGRDVGAGRAAGCRTIRIHPEDGEDPADEVFRPDFTVRNLVEAARIIMREPEIVRPDTLISTDHPESSPKQESTDKQPPDSSEEEASNVLPQATTHPGRDVLDDSDVRKEILRHVRQLVHEQAHEEFNLLNLLGGVAQVLVGLFLLLVFYKAVSGGDNQEAILWALVGVIFQTMSLTFFIMAGRKK